MEEFIFTAIVFGFALGIHQVVVQRHIQAFEKRLLTFSFFAHMAAAWGLIVVYTYYYTEGGDMITYHRFAVPIADAMRLDFGLVTPEVTSLFLQREQHLPFDVNGEGSTGTMQAIAIFLSFGLGNSLFASATLIALLSYLSKVGAYHALRTSFPDEQQPIVLAATTLSPSGVMWTCGLLKEPITMILVGPMMLSVRWILENRRLAAAGTILTVGALGMSLVKAYVLVTLGLAAGVWFAWDRVIKRRGSVLVKPVYLGVAVAVTVLGFGVASKVFPRLALESLGETISYQRRVSALEVGRSNFYLEEPDVSPEGPAAERSLLGQLGLAPLAVVTALFRPFIFESTRAMQLLNAIEMTWLTILFWQVFRRNGTTGLVRRLTASPALMFCATFTLTLALGTGLSTANLGTLSRYRAPMMPFFLLLLLTLREPESAPTPRGLPLRPAVER